jgi:hypothetical protein
MYLSKKARKLKDKTSTNHNTKNFLKTTKILEGF